MLDGKEGHGVRTKNGFKGGFDLCEIVGPRRVVGLDVDAHLCRGKVILYILRANGGFSK